MPILDVNVTFSMSDGFIKTNNGPCEILLIILEH